MSHLRIVSINDVYSLASLPRLATLVQRARVVDPPDVFLLVVAGDFLAPSLLSSLDGGRGMVDCLNALGVTHVTLGNHEDDLPFEQLVQRLDELHAKVLVTNAETLQGRHQASDVVEVAGARVGLVGVTDADPALYRRAPFGGAQFRSPNQAVVAEASRLRGEGCVAVIALTHQRLADDRALVALHAVDVVLGGHEHEGYLEAPLAKAPMNATAAVIADLHLEPTGPRIAMRIEPVAGYPEDPSMRARVDGHLESVRALEARVLVTLPEGTVLSSLGSRSRQTSLGTLICSRLRDALGAEVGLFNGGGIRGETEHRGQFTYADLRDELPFDNEMAVASIPGSVLRDAIRFARTELRTSGGFLHVDDAAEVDACHELVRLAGAPLDPLRSYRVAIVRDLLLGMDHIEPLAAYVRAHPAVVPPATTGLETKVALLRSFV